MSKYLRSQHVPLNKKEEESLEEGFQELLSERSSEERNLKRLQETKGRTQEELGKKIDLDSLDIENIE